jgi:hypothetical protein
MEAQLNKEYVFPVLRPKGKYSRVVDMLPRQVRRSPGSHPTNHGRRIRHCKARRGWSARGARTAPASEPTGYTRRKVTAVRHPCSQPAVGHHGFDFANEESFPAIRDLIRYLQERRLGGDPNGKRAADEMSVDIAQGPGAKRPRGRPKGSKNRLGKAPGGGGQAPEAVPA